MKLQALWYGGINYALPTQDDIEDFRSIKHARRIFESRASFDPMFPCVDHSEMHLFFTEFNDNGPDRILKIGPKGGVRMERG